LVELGVGSEVVDVEGWGVAVDGEDGVGGWEKYI